MPDVTTNDVQEQPPLKYIATNEHKFPQLLTKANSASGISGQEFQKLFIKCDLCRCVMTLFFLAAHNCDIIDLTGDMDME